MAVIEYVPHWERTTGGRLDLRSLQFVRTAEMKATILVSDPFNDTDVRVKHSGFVPLEGSRHPDDPNLIVISSVVRNLGPLAFENLVTYETIPEGDPATGGQAIQRGWTVEFDSDESEEPFDRDVDGRAVVTVTGEGYDPPITDSVEDFTLTFTTHNRPFPPGLLALYRNSLNSDFFLGFPPGTCRMKRRRGRVQVFEDKPPEMECSVFVAMRFGLPGSSDFRAWWKRVRAEGYYVFDRDGRRVRAIDDNGEPSSKPVLHRIEGSLGLPPGTQIIGTNAADMAEFYEFMPPWLVYRPFNSFFNSIAGV